MKTIFKRFGSSRKSAQDRLIHDLQAGKIRRIALVRGRGIGDLITFIPTLRKISLELPGIQVTWVTSRSPYIETILEDCPYRPRIVQFDDEASLLKRFQALWRIRSERFDLIIAGSTPTNTSRAHTSSRKTALLSYLSGARYRIGAQDDTWSFLYNIRVHPYRTNIVESGLSYLEPLGLGTREEDKRLELFVDFRESSKAVDEILKRNNISDTDLLVVLHTGVAGGYSTRLWSDERWTEVADALAEKYQAKTLFIGAPDERERLDEILRPMKNEGLNLGGWLSLNQTAALIRKCSLVVCTNSGPMHLAAAVQTPLVALCGPSPKMWDPCSSNACVIRKGCCDRFCEARLCERGDNVCMMAITVADVIEAAEKQLGRLSKAS